MIYVCFMCPNRIDPEDHKSVMIRLDGEDHSVGLCDKCYSEVKRKNGLHSQG